jgi:K+-sensing histidine kinase KdpD
VNTLLDFSRLESGRMNAKFRPTRLGPRVAELADLFRSAIERGGIEYTVDVGEDKWADKRPFYLADEMVEKVVFNVIGYASQSFPACDELRAHTPACLVQKCVQVYASRLGARQGPLHPDRRHHFDH